MAHPFVLYFLSIQRKLRNQLPYIAFDFVGKPDIHSPNGEKYKS